MEVCSGIPKEFRRDLGPLLLGCFAGIMSKASYFIVFLCIMSVSVFFSYWGIVTLLTRVVASCHVMNGKLKVDGEWIGNQ